jgi:hypothetical protein
LIKLVVLNKPECRPFKDETREAGKGSPYQATTQIGSIARPRNRSPFAGPPLFRDVCLKTGIDIERCITVDFSGSAYRYAK